MCLLHTINVNVKKNIIVTIYKYESCAFNIQASGVNFERFSLNHEDVISFMKKKVYEILK